MDLFDGQQSEATDNARLGIDSSAPASTVKVETTIEDDLEALYQQIFDVATQRRALKDELAKAFKDKCGFDPSAVDEAMGHDNADERKIAKELLTSMLGQDARKRIGINAAVAVDTHELNELFMEPIDEAHNRRYSHYRRDQDEEGEVAIPRLDIRGAIAYLRKTYGGETGEQARIAQVVTKFKDALRLERNTFEVKAGKVNLEFNVYSSDWELERGSYGSGAKEVLSKMVCGFEELFDYFHEPVPSQLMTFKFNLSRTGPGNTYELGPAFRIRAFKSHVRLTMTEGLAEKMREFIAEFS